MLRSSGKKYGQIANNSTNLRLSPLFYEKEPPAIFAIN